MNLLLWAFQIILAVKLLTATYTHGLRPDETKMQRGRTRFGSGTRPLLVVTALATLLGALLLILPGLLGATTAVTEAAAAAVGLMLLVGMAFHLGCRDRRYLVVGLILAGMAAFVAYWRWILAPL